MGDETGSDLLACAVLSRLPRHVAELSDLICGRFVNHAR